jgi:hypothetical protein
MCSNGNTATGHPGLETAVELLGYVNWPKATDVHASLLDAIAKCVEAHPL